MRPAVHMADLLRALRAQPDAALRPHVAAALGYELRLMPTVPALEEGDDEQSDTDLESAEAATTTKATESAAPPPAPQQPLFWRLAADITKPDHLGQPAWLTDALRNPPTEERFHSRVVLPEQAPLLPAGRAARLLRQQLARPRPGREVDLRWLVQRVAAGKPVARLRRLPRLRWPLSLNLVLQAHTAVLPLVPDLLPVAWQLKRLFGQRLRRFVSHGGPQHLVDDFERPSAVPADGSAVFVLGDAGEYAGTAAHRHEWQGWARRLQRSGGRASRPLLWAPLPRRLLHRGTAQAFDVLLLDEGARPGVSTRAGLRGDDEYPGPRRDELPTVEHQALAAMLAGLPSVPWPLLRLLRRGLRAEGFARADIGLEIEWAQHAEVLHQRLHTRLASFAEDAAAARFMRTMQALPGLQQSSDAEASFTRLFACVDDAAAALSPVVQAERWVYWRRQQQQSAAAGQPLPAGVQQRVSANSERLQSFAREAAAAVMVPGGLGEELGDYLGAMGHHDPARVGRAPLELQTAWGWAQRDALREGRAALPEGLDLQALAWIQDAGGPPRALVAEGLPGQGLRLRLLAQSDAPTQALCRDLPDVAQVAVQGPQETAALRFHPATATLELSPTNVAHEPSALVTSTEEPARRTWRLDVGARSVEIEPFTRPAWASAVWLEAGVPMCRTTEGRVLRWVPRRAFAIDGPRSGAPRMELPHGAWWDDAEYRDFVGPEERLQCPPWASAGHGSDEFGYWAAFEVRGVVQTMRFMPPGRFLMGSPTDEIGRFGGLDSEVQRPVVLSRGFWMADTACTQALWKAVTGCDPSDFKNDAENPVEWVSWIEVQGEFLVKLNHRQPGLELRLPSDAQWEYAARCAGRGRKAFCWGAGGEGGSIDSDDIDTDCANYNGNYPLRTSDPKGEYRERTLAVKSFKPNAMGLWQMHGNVWEWVQDLYAEYPVQVMVDPEVASAADATGERVLRGGSWFSDARHCRSAQRYWIDPGSRDWSIGFRLARGLPSEPAEPGPEARGLGSPEASLAPAAERRGRPRSSAAARPVARGKR